MTSSSSSSFYSNLLLPRPVRRYTEKMHFVRRNVSQNAFCNVLQSTMHFVRHYVAKHHAPFFGVNITSSSTRVLLRFRQSWAPTPLLGAQLVPMVWSTPKKGRGRPALPKPEGSKTHYPQVSAKLGAHALKPQLTPDLCAPTGCRSLFTVVFPCHSVRVVCPEVTATSFHPLRFCRLAVF